MGIEELRNILINKLKILNDIEPLSYLLESMQGEYAVLSLLAEKINVSPSEISKYLNISKSRSTVILNSLKKKQFVTLSKSEVDKRKLIASLTTLGEESLNKKVTQASTFFDDYLKELGEEDAKKLIGFLDKSIKIANKKVNNN